MKTRTGEGESARELRLQGLGVAPGVAIGPVHLRDHGSVPVPEYQVPQSHVGSEIERFATAIKQAERQLAKLRGKAEAVHGASAEELGFLLEAHVQMLRSSQLREGVHRRIQKDRANAAWAVAAEIEQIVATFAGIDDAYLRTRGEEVRQIGQRILRNLTERRFQSFGRLPRNSLVLAEEITPADTALMDPRQISGFASVLGGAEGHTAIMARSLGLPAVLGVADLLRHGRPGAQAILDGNAGLVILDPDPQTLAHYRRLRSGQLRATRALTRLRDLPAITRDGTRIELQANLELPPEVEQAAQAGADGVGLLRTEFLFMNREDLPDEDEQTAAIRHIQQGLPGQSITVRTLDVGGEKLASSLGGHLGESANPALGLRAIRLSLRVPALLETQLAATLRASAHGPVRILLPMIATLDELRAVRRILQKVARRLRAAGVPIADPLPPLGVMIEVPAAALAADALAAEADFFAIGTNDLIMYTLAIDRGDERVAYLYDPLHPAVIRLVHFAVEAARGRGRPVSVCGEMAADPRFAPLFIGLGVRELSVSPKALPRVKQRIRRLDCKGCAELAHAMLLTHDRDKLGELLDAFPE